MQINSNYYNFIINEGFDRYVATIVVHYIKIIAFKKCEIIKRVKINITFAFVIANLNLIRFNLNLKVKRNKEKKIIKLL